MSYLLILVGFALLIKGADWMVKAAREIAYALGVSAYVVGMSVVAFGTSLPEVSIGVLSGIEGANELSLGNVIGGCIANAALVLGAAAVLSPIGIERKVLRVDLPISLFVHGALLAALLFSTIFTRAHGIVLLALFALYSWYLFHTARGETAGGQGGEEGGQSRRPGVKTVLMMLAGLAGLVIGAQLVVDNAADIARQFGMSEALIGATVVAFGTSLPELITTVTASVRRETGIAVGNIIGSNIINVCLVLGLTVTIHPIAVPPGVVVNASFMAGLTALLFLLALPRRRLGRWAGAMLLAGYFAFIACSVVKTLPVSQ